MSNQNFTNQTIWTGDNLDIMRGLNSESVDLIYLDPPFNSNANYAAPIGSKAAGAEFKDTWGLNDINLAWHGLIKGEYPHLYQYLDAVKGIHGNSMMSYLIYMTPRLMEMHRLLKPTGSIYLHCDPTASHYLKIIMDRIFGKDNFRNEIVWDYKVTGAGTSKLAFQKRHDILLLYSKGKNPTFNILKDGTPTDRMQKLMKTGYNKCKQANGKRYLNIYNRQLVDQYIASGRLNLDDYDVIKEFDATQGKRIADIFNLDRLIGTDSERVGYPTQKPTILVERIINASSNPGDTILDPFCGCATACIAAEKQERNWIGIDVSSMAATLVQDRMRNELGLFYKGAHRTDIPKRTDLDKIEKYNSRTNKKYIYGQQEGYCNGCAKHFEHLHLEVDHIIPRSKGGTDHISNLQLLCAHCNRTKGNRSQEWLMSRLLDKKFITSVVKDRR